MNAGLHCNLCPPERQSAGAYRLGCGVGEDGLSSLLHIVEVHDDGGDALIAQLRMPPVLQPVRVRL